MAISEAVATKAVSDKATCLFRETGDPLACLNCKLPICVEDTTKEGTTKEDTTKAEVKQADWIEEFAKKNRPLCPSCKRPMERGGIRLWTDGSFRTFKFKCHRCKKYAKITTQEVGYREPIETDWKDKFADDHRPWCCGKPMQRASSRLWESTGVRLFRYKCSVCRGWKTVKTYEPNNLSANPTLEALDTKDIDRLIRSKIGDNEDGVQDAWLAVLERGVTTEDDVLKVAEEVFKSRRHQFIDSEHTDVSLSEFTAIDKDNPIALDRVKVLSTEDTIPIEGATPNEPTRCPHCGSRGPFGSIGSYSDGKGKRRRFICKTCWRSTLWPRRQQSRKLGKIHITEVSKGDEVDLASVSRTAVAKAAHCSAPYVSAILCGHATASLPLFYDIAKACNTTMDELFKAITGANGQNPAMIKAKYIVNGKGYHNLWEAALSLGVELRRPTHYKELPSELQAQIVRNRPFRGR